MVAGVRNFDTYHRRESLRVVADELAHFYEQRLKPQRLEDIASRSTIEELGVQHLIKKIKQHSLPSTMKSVLNADNTVQISTMVFDSHI